MRKLLKSLNNSRQTFTGDFVRFGTKPAYRGDPLPTLLLANIKDQTGTVIADHLWFNLTDGFRMLRLDPGDTVQFDARVKKYEKGYRGPKAEKLGEDRYEWDYKLSHPTKLSVLPCNPSSSEPPR